MLIPTNTSQSNYKGYCPLLEPEFDRYWELEQGSGQITDAQGRLKLSAKFWKEGPQPVLEWISKGYKLPLLSLPPPYFQRNQKSVSGLSLKGLRIQS